MSDLLTMLKERSYEKKQVRLASGKRSDFYIDCKKTFLWQDGMMMCAQSLISCLRRNIIDGDWKPVSFVAGTGLGGGPLCAAMVIESLYMGNKLDMIYVRKASKDHGSLKRIEGGNAADPFVVIQKRSSPTRFPQQQSDYRFNVALIEDVVTSGGSALSACQALTESGYKVEGVIAIVDRLEGGREALLEHGYKLDALYTKADFQ